MNVALWIAAGVLATVLLISTSKAFVPREKIAAVGGPAPEWVEDFSPSALRAIATLELLAAAGLILPAALDIAPVLVPLAATGTALLFIGAVKNAPPPRREGDHCARPGLSRPGHIRGVGPFRPRVLYRLRPVDTPGPSDGFWPRRPAGLSGDA